jgi:hypothetical protein
MALRHGCGARRDHRSHRQPPPKSRRETDLHHALSVASTPKLRRAGKDHVTIVTAATKVVVVVIATSPGYAIEKRRNPEQRQHHDSGKT